MGSKSVQKSVRVNRSYLAKLQRVDSFAHLLWRGRICHRVDLGVPEAHALVVVAVVVAGERERKQAVQLLGEGGARGHGPTRAVCRVVVQEVLFHGGRLQLHPHVAAVLAVDAERVLVLCGHRARCALFVVTRKGGHGRNVRPGHARLQVAVRLALLLRVVGLLVWVEGALLLHEARPPLKGLHLGGDVSLHVDILQRGRDRHVVHQVPNRQQLLRVVGAVVHVPARLARGQVGGSCGRLLAGHDARAQRAVHLLHPVLVVRLERRAVPPGGRQRPDRLEQVHRVGRRHAARRVRLLDVDATDCLPVLRKLVALEVVHVLLDHHEGEHQDCQREREVQRVCDQEKEVLLVGRVVQPVMPTLLECPRRVERGPSACDRRRARRSRGRRAVGGSRLRQDGTA